jgi:DNA segregation ATPase FtsK/SpoIIIE-like protein
MSETAEPGYIYALINYSMPGLVKVGRTARPPLDRLDELSGATGVPTPFQLVFDILVPDAPSAEQALHAILTERGYRYSDNREFFHAPIHEVVSLMLQLRERVGRGNLLQPALPEFQSGPTPNQDPLLRSAAEACLEAGEASTSVLQRKLRIGYGQAATLIDQLHDLGIIGPPDGTRPRRLLMTQPQLERIVPSLPPDSAP